MKMEESWAKSGLGISRFFFCLLGTSKLRDDVLRNRLRFYIIKSTSKVLIFYGNQLYKMSRQRPLRGACSCGRNRYVIVVPEDATEQSQIFFDEGSDHRISAPSHQQHDFL